MSRIMRYALHKSNLAPLPSCLTRSTACWTEVYSSEHNWVNAIIDTALAGGREIYGLGYNTQWASMSLQNVCAGFQFTNLHLLSDVVDHIRLQTAG